MTRYRTFWPLEAACELQMPSYDLRISGGRIVDGSGRDSCIGDVAVSGGRIVALGEASGEAKATIDAAGMVVAPGFIDVHTHYDAQILWDRMLTVSPWHGVTTAVLGNCGFGIAPTKPEHRELIMETLKVVEGMSLEALRGGLGSDWPFVTFPEYLTAIETRGMAINVGVLVGHTPLRLFVMGPEAATRTATPDEIERMAALLREALAAGALGFGTSQAATHNGFRGLPVPSRLAAGEELHALARVLREFEGRVLQIARVNKDYLDGLAELSRVSNSIVSYVALFADAEAQGPHRPLQQRIAELNGAGAKIVPQVSCRPVMFDYDFKEPFMLGWAACVAELGRCTHQERRAAYADPEFRRKLQETLASQRPRFLANTRFSHVPLQGGDRLIDHSVVEEAAARGVAPVDLLLDVAVETNLELRVATAVANGDEAQVLDLLRDHSTIVALSDAGAHANQICDACYTTHLLGRWVREKNALSLEEAVRLLTSRPAEVFGIRDRGRLEPGYAADIVVFDEGTVAPGPLTRIADLPAGAERLIAEAIGIKAVIVNGALLRLDGRDVPIASGQLPGRLLRRGQGSPRAD